MRTLVMAVTASLIFFSQAALAQTGSSPRSTAATLSRSAPGHPPSSGTLAGMWRSAPFELSLTSDFHKSVWGPNAKSVRTVVLQVQPSGEATLTVNKRVVDARGRTVAASTSVEEAQIRIGMPKEGIATRVEYDVAVVKAERRYPDDPSYRWTIDGLQVELTGFTDLADSLEVRFDPPDGNDSFWETLRRAGRSAPQRSSP
jgi:hypothetical protein